MELAKYSAESSAPGNAGTSAKLMSFILSFRHSPKVFLILPLRFYRKGFAVWKKIWVGKVFMSFSSKKIEEVIQSVQILNGVRPVHLAL